MYASADHRFIPQEDVIDLCRSVSLLQDGDAVASFLRELCTPQELTMFAERWTIAKLMYMGFSYRIISQKTGASSATIARLAQNLRRGNGAVRRLCLLREQALSRRFKPPADGSLS